nr:MAG TPA: hypothetical protein [Bacteriophage sp.]DAU68007.1 MAG TPA: hypothetical protein [Caudoviricetes sp.]
MRAAIQVSSVQFARLYPPFGCCMFPCRSDYLLTVSGPLRFRPLGRTLLCSGFPRHFDSRYTFTII